MAKIQKRYVCQSCGSVSSRWQGQCPDCSEWNTMLEEAPVQLTPFAAKHNLQGGAGRSSLSDWTPIFRCPTGWRRASPNSTARWAVGSSKDRPRSSVAIRGSASRPFAPGGGEAGHGGQAGRLCLGRGGRRPGASARAATGTGAGPGSAGGGDLGSRHPDHPVDRHAASTSHHRLDPDDALRPDRGRAGDGQPGSRVGAGANPFRQGARHRRRSGRPCHQGRLDRGPRVLEHMVDTVLAFEGNAVTNIASCVRSRTASAEPTKSASSPCRPRTDRGWQSVIAVPDQSRGRDHRRNRLPALEGRGRCWSKSRR